MLHVEKEEIKDFTIQHARTDPDGDAKKAELAAPPYPSTSSYVQGDSIGTRGPILILVLDIKDTK